MNKLLHMGLAALSLAAISSSARAQIVEFPIEGRTVSIHGFLTQGFMKSDGNNFITAQTGNGTGLMADGALNIGMNVTDKLHIGAQVYDRYIGRLGKGKADIDWAYADYRVKDWLGFRGGKIKTAMGLYNDTQDMDFLHTWALLPQSIYPTDLRSVNIAQIGGSAYGGISMNRMGTVSYQMYGGVRTYDWRSGDIYGLADQNLPATKLPNGTKIGEDIRWRTPIQGLLIGMSHESLDQHLVGQLLPQRIPAQADQQYDNIWDGYGQYGWKNLRFAGEYQTESRANAILIGGRPTPNRAADLRSMFGSVTYRFNKWFQAGTYHSRFNFTANAIPGVIAGAESHVYDQAVTGRFDFQKHWYLKVEGHFMDGVGSPISARGFYVSDNPQGLKNKTNLLVVRLGFSM